jgi:hypothetical protein
LPYKGNPTKAEGAEGAEQKKGIRGLGVSDGGKLGIADLGK